MWSSRSWVSLATISVSWVTCMFKVFFVYKIKMRWSHPVVKLWPSCARLTDQLGRVKGHLAENMIRGGMLLLTFSHHQLKQRYMYIQ